LAALKQKQKGSASMKLNTALAITLALSATAPAVGHAQTPPTANPAAPENSALKAPHENKAGAPAKGHNSFTKGQAQKHIEKEGYTQVTGLAKDKDGLWQGMAMKDGKPVHVAVDFEGNVTSN
jgi:hypothetical protein